MAFKRHRSTPPLVFTAGVLLALYVAALVASQREGRRTPLLAEVERIAAAEPVRVLPHTGVALVALEASGALEQGRPWKAWKLLRDVVGEREASPAHVLLAARAAAEWGGWGNVRRLLSDRQWLAGAGEGEGLFLLGRAEEEHGDGAAAAAAYQRYLELGAGRFRGEARVRLARVLAARGEQRAAAAAYGAAAAELPELADWLLALRAEQLAGAGVLPGTAAPAQAGAAARARHALAEAKARRAAGDATGATRRLELETRILRGQGAGAEAARLQMAHAELLREQGRAGEARDLLRAVAWEATAPSDLRLAAAEALGELEGRGVAEEMARSMAYEAARKPGLAAKALRAAMAQGAPDERGLQLRLARLLYAERDFGPARAAFRRAAELVREPDARAEAELYAARSLYRGSPRSRSEALAEYRRVAEQHPSSPAAATALFLLGDAASSLEQGIAYYRRAAATGGSPEAREALYRVGDRSLKRKDTAGAIRAWEEYVERYPRGEETARVAYETGRMHERAGRDARARAMYAAAMRADPVSYHAIRASDRLGVDPLTEALAEPRPWPGLATDAADARAVLARLRALHRLGLVDEWRQERDQAERRFAERPAALLALAEGLRDAGHPVDGIRIGRALLERRRGEWDERLLRVVFPFPYREVLTEEAEREDVDPMLLAGLVRQESSFRADARSWVGARGLGQVMPATGRWLAPAAGISRFDESLLDVPEISLRMAAKYLGDLLEQYDGARDLALAAYNAGPSRATRWRRELGYRRSDPDRFREAIPFDETREYVKIVLRNAAVYQRLYGRDREGGLVRGDG